MSKHDSNSAVLQAAAVQAGQECLAFTTRRISRIITRLYDDALRPYGIKVSQFSLLAVLAMLGPTPAVELARRLDLEKSTLSRNLQRLQSADLVRVADSNGTQGMELSPLGKKRLNEAMTAWRQIQERVQAILGRNTIAMLKRVSQRLHDM